MLTYYNNTSNGGGPGDLELIQTYDTADESGPVINATFYRDYEGGYDASTNPGLPGELKFTVSGAALERLMTANNVSSYGQLDGLTDAQIAPYADDFYKYDPAGLVEEIDASGAGCSTCGGVGASTFAYAFSGSTQTGDTNQWNTETIETRADGSKVSTFDNFQGQTILQDTWNGLSGSASQHSIVYNQYDNYGNVSAAYQPSAMTAAPAYTLSNNVLTEYPNAATGLVDVNAYYTSATATVNTTLCPSSSDAGGVIGYLQASGVQQGSGGKPDWQSSLDYVAEKVDGITAFFTYRSTQYQNDYPNSTPPTPASTLSLSGANTTTYQYTFYSGSQTNAPTIYTATTVQPVVGNGQNETPAQNGSGTPPRAKMSTTRSAAWSGRWTRWARSATPPTIPPRALSPSRSRT